MASYIQMTNPMNPGETGVIKTCPCGLPYTQEGWDALPLAHSEYAPTGCLSETYEDEPGVTYTFKYRNCACGSTLVMQLSPPPDHVPGTGSQ